MSEGMSAVRLAATKELATIWTSPAGYEIDMMRCHAMQELLAEVDRLRARLDEIGETREEWGVRIFRSNPNDPVELMASREQAAEIAGIWREEIETSDPIIMQRTARDEGQWREVPDA